MYSALKAVVLVASILSVVVAWSSEGRVERLPVGGGAQTALGCRSGTASDSAYFLDRVRGIVRASAPRSLRDMAGLPIVPPDSVQFIGLHALCEAVSNRYRNHVNHLRGDTLAPLFPVLLLRVSPNRYVGDPFGADSAGRHRLYITVDSLAHTVAIWGVRM